MRRVYNNKSLGIDLAEVILITRGVGDKTISLAFRMCRGLIIEFPKLTREEFKDLFKDILDEWEATNS